METGNTTTWMVLVGLLAFGCGYNALVAWLEKNGHDRGYTAFLVVGGCLATILGVGFLLGRDSALTVFLCFAASGLPMVVGSMARYAQKERSQQQRADVTAIELLKGGEND